MKATRMIGAIITGTVIAVTACNNTKSELPKESQVTGDVRNPGVPMTVAGCLRAGESADTYVLAQDQKTGTQETANYQLVGVQGVDLRKHVGERVQVNGVLASQQEVASRSMPEQQKPTGTTGTPTVQTETRVDMRTLKVSSVNPQGEKCEEKK